MPVVHWATGRLAAVIQEGWPEAPVDATQLLSESLVRLAISYAALPTGPAGTTAASMTTLLGPFVEQVTGVTAESAA